MCVIFVLKLGKGVFTFTLDPMYSEYVLTQENIEIPKAGKYILFQGRELPAVGREFEVVHW